MGQASIPNYGPAGGPTSRRGFLVPPNGLRGSHCGAAAFEGLSCGGLLNRIVDAEVVEILFRCKVFVGSIKALIFPVFVVVK